MTGVPAVAIVGMSGRFPGSGSLDQYWDNLTAGICSVADFTAEELMADGVTRTELERPGYVPAKGFLANADRFEADLFGFGRTESAVLDPQHRVLLETAWSALEHAGLDPLGAPARTGVYVGCSASEHALAAQTDRALADQIGLLQLQTLTGQHFLAPWLSYRLGLQGPSLTVQAACATSLAAIHLAVQALLLNECDLALAGGVSIDCVAKRGYRFLPGGILAPDGRCRPFDERAAGTVPGCGAGLLVLRRFEDAQADNDPVLAVIRGSAVTNDGSAKLGFTAPSVDQQSAAIAEAWDVAGLDRSAVQYIEMHGTATKLGDRVEVAAAATAFGTCRSGSCGIGSVKANIGHLDAAAGVAGVIKTVLMLQHGLMVPSANVSRAHPELCLDQTPFTLLTEAVRWEARGDARRAGVTSIGIGGTNVHLVLEQAPEQRGDHVPDRVEMVPLSARTEPQLAAAMQRLADALRKPGAPALRDVAHTLRTGRRQLAARSWFAAASSSEAARILETSVMRQRFAPGSDDVAADLRTLGDAWMNGAQIRWPASAPGARRTHLPTYPFSGESYGALTLAYRSESSRPAPGPSAEPPGGSRPGRKSTAMTLAEVFAASLDIDNDDLLDSSFLENGGDSLTAINLAGKLSDDFGVEIPIETFLEPISLRELAERIGRDADAPHDNESVLADLIAEIESGG